MSGRFSLASEGSVPAGRPCPILTERAVSLQEACGITVPEIRAYKLGKKRWSYNQVEVVLMEAGGTKQLHVQQASSMAAQDDGEDGSVLYDMHLSNGLHLKLRAYLCYDHAEDASNEEASQYNWTQVDRCACRRGCSGPVMRTIQRYGKLGKRRWNGSLTPDINDRTNHNMKDPRYLYLSFDEAGTHVGCQYFRMITAVYDESGEQLLGTAVTPPLRVVANNDVPTGAAHIQHLVPLPATWPGWVGVPDFPEQPASMHETVAQTPGNEAEMSAFNGQVTPSQGPETKMVRTSSRQRRSRIPTSPYSKIEDEGERSGSLEASQLPFAMPGTATATPIGHGSPAPTQAGSHGDTPKSSFFHGSEQYHPHQHPHSYSPQVVVKYVDPLEAFARGGSIGYGNDIPAAPVGYMGAQQRGPSPGPAEDPLMTFMELMLQMPDPQGSKSEDNRPVLELPGSPLVSSGGMLGGSMPPQLVHSQQHAQLMQLWQEQNGVKRRKSEPQARGDAIDLMQTNHFDQLPAHKADSSCPQDKDINLNANSGMLCTPTPSMLDDLLCNLQHTLDGAAEALLLNDDAFFNGLSKDAGQVFAR